VPRRQRSLLRLLGLLLPLVAVSASLAACGGDDDDSVPSSGNGAEQSETTTSAPEEAASLRILVTDDDGVEGPGMDALVTALAELPDTEVTVVAPAEDQSGTGNTTSPAPPEATDTTLPGGHEAVAVAGFPADAVVHALSTVFAEDDPPDLVVSGINAGQNLGPVALDLSGTVGAARTAAAAGIPALAVSQGIGDQFDYDVGVELTLDWIDSHRDALLAGEVATDTVANLNVPSCASGEIKGVLEVETATDAGDRNILAPVDCTLPEPGTEPTDDIDAFTAGYAPLADVALGDAAAP
jgi:5'-nucleotidase